MSWDNDPEFVAWLDAEGIGTDDDPVDDDTLNLMSRAWQAGRASAPVIVADRIDTVNM